jgi:hypothetical protein
MKKCLLLLILFPFASLSQTWMYHPFPSSMIVYGGNNHITVDGNNYTQQRVEMYGDTVIGAYSYKKVYKGITSLQLTFGIRQDIPAKKVYQYDMGSSTERLLFDFDMVVGDTVFNSSGYGFYYGLDGCHPDCNISTAWSPDTVVVTRIDSVLMPHDGLYHKRFNFSGRLTAAGGMLVSTDSAGPYPDPSGGLMYEMQPLIEGVGQLYGPAKSASFFEGGFQHEIFCASIDGYPVISNFYTGFGPYGYLEPAACNSLISGIDELASNQLTILPNPVLDILEISSFEKIGTVEITDIMGKQILGFSVESSETKIDLSALSPGVYFVRLKNTFKKIVRQ